MNAVDLLLVEDTRVTQRLLQHYSISCRSIPLHEHNEAEITARLLARLTEEGLAVALLSDAGTPLIADPGYRLVGAAQEAGIPVHPVPGPCAAIAALSIAGMATDRFAFEGFLPARSAARTRRLRSLVDEPRTLIFYEAPHRILATMEDLCAVFGDSRGVVVARELTKLHETVYRGALGAVAAAVRADPNAARGELVIVLAGATVRDSSEDEQRALHMVAVLSGHLRKAEAIKIAAEITGVKRNRLYRLALDVPGA